MLLDKGFDRKGNRYVIGYDLGDDYSQISFTTLNQEEPETISTIAGAQQYNIPTVLCKREDVNQWFYGKEALRVSGEGEGTRVDELLQKAKDSQMVLIEDQEYDPVALLALFIKRSLGLFNTIGSLEHIEEIVVTTEYLDNRTIEVLEQVMQMLGLRTKKIFFQNYMESFYDFMLYQTRDLWEGEVMVFDYRYPYMKSFRMECNKRTTPIVTVVEKQEYPEMRLVEWPTQEEALENAKRELDQRFYLAVKDILMEHMVKVVYLVGDGFRQEWQEQSLRFLCQNRRVFMGNNLYSKGAAYGALEKRCPSEMGKVHVFLGPEKIKANVGIQIIKQDESSYMALADAGQNWYDIQADHEIYLEDGNSFYIAVTPLSPEQSMNQISLGKSPVRYQEVCLEGLPERPRHTTRLRLRIQMMSVDKMMLEIVDLGFGEIFPATYQIWKQEISLSSRQSADR